MYARNHTVTTREAREGAQPPPARTSAARTALCYKIFPKLLMRPARRRPVTIWTGVDMMKGLLRTPSLDTFFFGMEVVGTIILYLYLYFPS